MSSRGLAAKVASTSLPFVVAIVIWQGLSMGFGNPILLPSPARVARSFLALIGSGELVVDFLWSGGRVAAGFAVGSVLGLVVGTLMGSVRRVEAFVGPLANFLQPIPKIAWIPLAILWFGLGFKALLFVVSMAGFWSVLFTTWEGVKTVNPVFVRVAQSLGAGRLYVYAKVLVPAALPHIMSGLRLGVARCWRALVAAELLIASEVGIGARIFRAREFLRTEEMIVGMVVLGLAGLLIEKVLFERIERRTLARWGVKPTQAATG